MDASLTSSFDHPIFLESVALIRGWLEPKGVYSGLSPLEQELLERLVHSSGDLELASQLHFSAGACAAGAAALAAGAPILTDTAMAAAAVAPMARRTWGNSVRCVLEEAPERAPLGETRSALGIERALARQGVSPVVLIGSAPTALERLLDLVESGTCLAPALVVGMPVGFVGVEASKRHLGASGLVHLGLGGSKGGAGLVAAACNALLRHGFLAAAGQA